MAMERSPSPPLPPDPAMRPKTVQPFKDPFMPSPMLQAQHQPVLPPDGLRSNTSRSRATSRPPPPALHQPQPVRDAVHDAFDSSPVAQNQFDPELVRHVTEQVIRNLQNVNVPSATPTPSVQPQQSQYVAPPPPRPPVEPVARSPAQSSTESIPQRHFTPPSPEKRQMKDDGTYTGSPSPSRRLPSDAGSSTYSRESMRSKASMSGSREMPRMDGAAGVRRSNTTNSRRRGDASDDERPRRRDSGSSTTTRTQSKYRRDSKGSESDYHEPSRSRARPPRIPSDVIETTTLEKIWQPLFDNGNPTIRLSQFLRGLALHLIDDYEPKSSLVIAPPKMLRFFNEVRLPEECYPWEAIFNGTMINSSLSLMYRSLRCEHHFIQNQAYDQPSIPCLTPNGFERLMTLLILAHPDNEYDRLARAVMNMPISNADNKSERFPKELTRRLLPAQGSLQAEQRIIASLNHEPLLGPLKGASNMPPPPPASAPPQQSSFAERERKPYSQTPHSNAIDDDDLGLSSMPIERERKPYTAREGAGKRYSNDGERERDFRPPTSQFRPEGPPPMVRSARSNSGLPTQATYSSSNGNGNGNGSSEPMNIPGRPHRQSMDRGPPPAMLNNMGNAVNGSLPKGRRTPPPRNPYVRSDPLDINGIPSSQYTSNLHTGYSAGGTRDHGPSDFEDESSSSRRHHFRRPTDRTRDRSTTNGTSNEDDAAGGRGYPIPPRPPPSAQGYVAEPGYGTSGAPPVGSYPRSNGLMSDARRSTWYGGASGAPGGGSGGGGGGGSDGYGSFINGGNGYPSQTPYGSTVQH